MEPLRSGFSTPLGEMRDRIFASGLWADAGLVLLVLWLLAQLNPALPFFGAGNITEESGPRFYADLLLVIRGGPFDLQLRALRLGADARDDRGAARHGGPAQHRPMAQVRGELDDAEAAFLGGVGEHGAR
jgi:hypothetical protein